MTNYAPLIGIPASYRDTQGFRVHAVGQVNIDAVANVARGIPMMSPASGDRLRHELDRIIQEERPAPALRRAIELGILAGIHPALTNPEAIDRLEASGLLGKVSDDSGVDDIQADDGRGIKSPPMLFLAALVYALSPGDGEGIIGRLNLPGAWAEVVRDTIALRE